ncbi:hypothetical protein SAV31267_047590 [Streptomyces avermitilis]|uniref:Uncharacterized protein n=1 Tax=Streptomyces avermitilis TaxID=33903 RepID=A0A4D4MU49_STRAX|nr:hypothetical protein SAV31267_047590 [Streptomyces avermitilis]
MTGTPSISPALGEKTRTWAPVASAAAGATGLTGGVVSVIGGRPSGWGGGEATRAARGPGSRPAGAELGSGQALFARS